MTLDKLSPYDSRVERHSANIRGKTYSYILSKPRGSPTGTAVLVHGFPDLGFGWRNQVPLLTSLGLRVVVPDMLGYGQTDAPEEVEPYSLKSLSDDIKELAAHVAPGEQIILGGHDWGGVLVWRVADWHPELVRGVFSVCSPYFVPSKEFVDLPDMIAAGKLKNFAYQLQFGGPEVEAKVRGEAAIRSFLNAAYGGSGPAGEAGFSPFQGILFENFAKLGPTPLLTETELDYYVKEYARHGMHGPLNWYRTRKLNFEEELPLVERGPAPFARPALFIGAAKDGVLKPELSAGMENYFENLTRREVDTSHWALWQAPEDVNRHLKDWIQAAVLGEDSSKASL